MQLGRGSLGFVYSMRNLNSISSVKGGSKIKIQVKFRA